CHQHRPHNHPQSDQQQAEHSARTTKLQSRSGRTQRVPQSRRRRKMSRHAPQQTHELTKKEIGCPIFTGGPSYRSLIAIGWVIRAGRREPRSHLAEQGTTTPPPTPAHKPAPSETP